MHGRDQQVLRWMSNVLDSGLSSTEYMAGSGGNAQTGKFLQDLCLTSKGVVGEKKILFVVVVKPAINSFAPGCNSSPR
jgi:hypothetical protein